MGLPLFFVNVAFKGDGLVRWDWGQHLCAVMGTVACERLGRGGAVTGSWVVERDGVERRDAGVGLADDKLG